jgi:hypothetical protein
MTDPLSFEDFVTQASAAAQKPQPPPRETYRGTVLRLLDEDPDMADAVMIRRVFKELEFESSPVDAMDDDELMRVVKVGRSTLAAASTARKARREAADVS